ncbi:MAG: Rpn family recombination-promoting nuclease/putative transposase [Fibromonadaceae bacterium]|nr:Rpn family recombination-promoting nuclease/putative transposase [Fibromonadaceae bacterium]
MQTIDGKLVVLIEHQSTVNENMPLRMLQYMAREYGCLTDRKDLYREKLIKIPTPEFIVLYNGNKKFPDYKELKLSDAFELRNEPFYLELVVKAYNINKGHNVEIAAKSPTLSGYEEFIAVIRENLKVTNLREAIKNAVRDCISRNILLSFLKKHSLEIENMILTEWNWDDAKSVWQEEAREEGREEGFGRGVAKVLEYLKQGHTIAEAEALLTK